MEFKNSSAGTMISCLVLFSMVLAACNGLQPTIAPQNRISLIQGGPHAGSWESTDVSLEYQYVYQAGTFKLNIGGDAKGRYDQLTVLILFVDAQGNVLKTNNVYNSGYREKLSKDRRSIERTYEIPTGSTQFAFKSMLKRRVGR